jgi:hypothetical protein
MSMAAGFAFADIKAMLPQGHGRDESGWRIEQPKGERGKREGKKRGKGENSYVRLEPKYII